MTSSCRICGGNLEAILTQNNMPKQAQYFPSKEFLEKDFGVNLKICCCENCNLVQLDTVPVNYYREVVRSSTFSSEMNLFRINQFGKFISKYELQDKNIIEVGCGKGEYLSILTKFCPNTFGLEFSKDAVDRCTRSSLKVNKGFIENEFYKIENAPFDAFFIMSYLEHIPNLNKFLKGLKSNLKPEAIGLIEVPNFDMILQERIFSEFITDHLFYFTENTLKRTLEYNGFDVIYCEPIWHNYILSAKTLPP